MVEKLIGKLARPETPVILCYNKKDTVDPDDIPRGENVVAVSAKTGEGLPELLRAVEKALDRGLHRGVFLLPYAAAGLLDTLHTQAKVLRCEYGEKGIEVEAVLDELLYGRLRDYETKGQ